jgi:hypothetical protein
MLCTSLAPSLLFENEERHEIERDRKKRRKGGRESYTVVCTIKPWSIYGIYTDTR